MSKDRISPDGRYWYDTNRGVAWPYDGKHSGDHEYIELVDVDRVLPILDILPRLWATGHRVAEQDGEWVLFDKTGEGLAVGATFRALCVNIILAGL